MLSLRHIERMVESKAYSRLIQRILANGYCDRPSAIQRLLEPRAVSPAALGFALQRVLELSYGPLELADHLVGMLLLLQSHDEKGDYEKLVIISPMSARAVVLRSLLKWQMQVGLQPKSDQASLIAQVSLAIERGLTELGRQISSESGEGVDPIDAFLIHWQLGDFAAAKKRIDFPALITRLNQASDQSLRSYAYASAA